MTDLFSSAAPESPTFDSTTPQLDESKNYLEELVGEGKKFKTVDDLAKGKAYADQMVTKLLQEKKEVEEELNKRRTVEDLLARMEQRNSGQMPTEYNQTQRTHETTANDVNSVSLDEIKAAIKADLEKERQEAIRQKNIAEASDALRNLYGDNVPSVLQAKASELGLTLDRLREVAADSPKALLALIGGPAQKTRDVFSPPGTAVNTAANAGQQNFGDHKPASYWAKLRQTDPKAYKDPKNMMAMHKSALALGDRYFDN